MLPMILTGRSRTRSFLADARRRAQLRSVWVVWIGLTAVLARLPLCFVEAHVTPGSDSAGYLQLASDISSGRYAGMFRTPGYPAFLWLVGLAPGRVEDGAIITQHLIGVGVAVSIVLVGWRLFGPVPAVIAGTLAAVSPTLLTLEDVILPDFLFGAAAFGGALALAVAATSDVKRWRLFVLAGVLFAVAAYIKPVGQVLVLAAPITFFASTRDFRTSAKASGIVIASMLIALSPWLLRNAVAYHEVGMSNQGGLTLFNRAFEVQRLPVPIDDPQGPLVRKLTEIANANPGLRPSSHVLNELTRRGWSLEDGLDIQQRLALTAISREPLSYAETSVTRLRAAVDDLNVYPEGPVSARLADAPAGLSDVGKAIIGAGKTLTQAWFLLTAFTLLALVMLFVDRPRGAAAASLVSVALLVLIATVLTHGGQWRYSVQIAPEAWLAASAGLVYVCSAVTARTRRLPRILITRSRTLANAAITRSAALAGAVITRSVALAGAATTHGTALAGALTTQSKQRFGISSFQATPVLLAGALALTPFWPVEISGQNSLTLGRGLLLVVAASMALDLVKGRRSVLPRAAIALFAGLAGLVAWTGASALSRGCFCYGGFGGLAEWSVWTAVIALVAVGSPDYRPLLLGSAAAGVTLGGALAALGVDDLAASVADTSVGERLGGIYGNPNMLAFAVAFAVPVLLVGTFRSGWRLRIPLIVALLGVATVIGLTFSRGGALAALLGGLAVVVAVPRKWRTRVAIAGGTVVVLGTVIALVYPYYADERLETWPAYSDASGWDRSAQGFVQEDGAELSNSGPGDTLKVSIAEPGQGVSIPLGRATPTRAYTVAFDARTRGPETRLLYGLEDNYDGNGPVIRSQRIRGDWERLRVHWIPTADSPDARFYAWSLSKSLDLFIRDIALITGSGNHRIDRRQISTRLLGLRSEGGLASGEGQIIDTRWTGVELGAQAFRSNPLLGIGWERFPAYAASRSDFGAIPTHNEYVRFAAELGAPGALLLLLIAVVAALAVGHLPHGPLRWGTLGVLVAGGVGLLFVNGLVFAAASAPLAVGVGLACSEGSESTPR
jgi:O-antigen ligase